MNKVAIVGCGWFGLPLAQQLVKDGLLVAGTKRTQQGCDELVQQGITPFELDLSQVNEQTIEHDTTRLAPLFDADVLIANIPPGLRRGESHYLTHIQRLKQLINGHEYKRVIFISTTGVYPSTDKDMFETDATAYDDKSAVLLEAESHFAAMQNSCIIRFSGLIGPKRHPGKFFGGRQDIAGGNVAVNLVHLDDCIEAIRTILQATEKGTEVASIYNLAAPNHPSRADFYQAAAVHLGLDAPQFNHQVLPSKTIIGNLICQQLGFNYIHPDPVKMLDAC
ncbi:SDR family oxidoreductase [Shewanella goraebulensis]|uniref:SDR family oxidoreductase n=1 Tax=Shewanella goraebulensis TaxID=3050637 RepID=UPI0025511B08|nr:SDR family oxidoreductase [Shewanella goraebulensis]